MNDCERIREACAARGLLLDDRQLLLLGEYARLLESKNRTINLVSRKEEAPLLIRHVFHSLLIGLFHPFRDGEKVIDIGTGGGLPGIPLAIAFPSTKFLLIDSIGKKITACQQMIRALELRNVLAKKARAEEIRGMIFDTVLSRQVAPLGTLCGYAEKLLKPSGTLLCLKGGDLKQEIQEAIDAAGTNNGFPSEVTTLPIEAFDNCFREKQIVIARR
ncbi:16S rRNA (guanine(527)-N(7))-methyltransferase RsmG [Prosthecochloris sp. GSB1]|uniref:16S rRNA (guanine(527)-N(7))-methyltransferase RsmG n=1 Tax=Prosthecochloris sp. GSB1 TaxID=281093 RepID=UPI000B8D0406|nr:16S rRNA (guanine(527)-N(7))-methyltransferase RsmG [Prosthecochloris sp. GSB1]ASQ91325.1 16S rRNA (guanine(527)-N(7))-methyltransferase RsmG [Prosthecochloris sp. GSB1]